ncbi:MAG: PAS domain S-box-containing protein [Cyclobacteriaceae bacterium]|jgi:PAS domain S-box-containing protein
MNLVKLSDLQSQEQLIEQIARLERRIERERAARKSAEFILESKSLELHNANKSLSSLNEQLEGHLERNVQFIQAINEFSSHLIGKNDIEEIASIVTHRLISKFGLEDCVIYKVAEGYCHQVSALGVKNNEYNQVVAPLQIKVGEGIVGHVATTGMAEIVSDTSKDSRYIVDDSVRLSELTVPIIFENNIIGIIDSEHSEKDFFTEDHLKTITTISRLIAVLFKNALTEQRNLTLESNYEKRSEMLNSLVQNLHSGLLLSDENGKIILTNSLFNKIFRSSLSDWNIIGADIDKPAAEIKHMFVDPEDFIEVLAYCRDHNTEVTRKEFEMVDGTILDCDFIPIFSKGHFIGQLLQIMDVTETRHASQQIAASEEKYRGIIENMELGLLEVNVDHKILKAYDWFCGMTGYTKDELIGKDAREVFLSDDFRDLMDEQDKHRLKGEQSIYEVQMRKKNGVFIWVLISGAPFYDSEGNLLGTIGIHYNIDARKRLEQDLQQSKEQIENAREAEKQFLANMSHEIRNPLNAIIGITNLLYDTNLNTAQLDHLNKLKYSSDMLMGLISGILDMSKIESGKLELLEKNLDLNEIVDGLIQVAGFNTSGHEVVFNNKIPTSNDFRAYADATILNQIFLNLINNAVKFTSNGSISIEAQVVESSNVFNRFEFKVVDTGIGISADKLESIFDIFQQADKETKLKYGGTGLGLNIVKKLVAMYDGRIRAESTVGHGTSIIFDLNLKRISLSSEKTAPVSYEKLGARRLLIVEDNEINQYYLSGILDKWNIPHDTAENGMIALEALEKNKYSLILMDIRMPVMDGYQTTINLRSMRQNANVNVPIIALTASALVDEREKALQAGMNHHLTKPYTEEDLGAILEKFDVIRKVESKKQLTYSFSDELDGEYLHNYYQDDVARAQTIFKIFERVIDDEFLHFKVFCKDENWKKAAAVAHKIKPNFSMVGLTHFSEQMDLYENLVEDSQLKIKIKTELPILEKELKAGKLVISKELMMIDQFLSI